MFNIPQPHLPEFNLKTVRLSTAEVKALSDDELLRVLNGESEHKGMIPLPLQQLITSELLARALERTSRPHWSVLPSFWLLVVSVGLALVAAVAGVLSLPQIQKHVGKTSSSSDNSAPVVKPRVTPQASQAPAPVSSSPGQK